MDMLLQQVPTVQEDLVHFNVPVSVNTPELDDCYPSSLLSSVLEVPVGA